MNIQRHSIIGILLGVFLSYGCESGSAPNPPAGIGLDVGQLAPDFTLKSQTGEDVSLSSFRGKNAVYLMFWATWCPYCVKEIPRLKELHAAFEPKGLKILAVNIGLNDPLIRVQAFQKQFQLPYTILYDTQTIISRQYGVIGVPFGVVVDRDGKVKYRSNMIPENLEALLEKEKPA